MPRPAIAFAQKDFSAGQVTANAARSDDVKLVKMGLKEATNLRLVSPRGFAPRFGRDVIYNDAGRTETVRFGVGMEYRITFGDGTITLRDAETGDVVFTQGSYPWALATLHEIVWASLDREIIICFPGSAPYVVNYRATVETQFSYGAGSVIGDLSFYGGLGAAFNGNGNKTYATSASNDVLTTGYVGKTFTTPRRVGKVIVRGSNDKGYDSIASGQVGDGSAVTLTLYGKTGAAPANATDGTSLGTTTFNDNNTPNEKSINSSNTVTAFDHLWVTVTTILGVSVADVRFFTPAGSEAWASAPFTFATNSAGVKRQPYYKFAQPDVAMTPAALTGNGITVNFSAPVLAAGHVGVSFRYCARELVCATVVSPTQGTFNVIETLPPTFNLTVGSTADFRIGEVCVGASSDCQALIVDIASSTVMKCIYIKRFAGFTTSEKITSPSGVTTYTSQASTTVAGTAFWDEAMMSDVRGWPASVAQDRNRIIFCDLPLVGHAVAESAIGLFNDFLPGSEMAEAILEYVPTSPRVYHVIGGPDQIVLTDKGVFFIPISESNPLVPGSVIFRKVGSLAAGRIKPVEMDQGIVFGAAGGNGIIAVLPTGQNTQPWELRDVSRYHTGLVKGLRSLAVQAGTKDSAEQYLWAVNADGSVVSGRFDPDNQWIGFVPVSGAGAVRWISTSGAEVLLNVEYDLGSGDTTRVVERINEDRFLDACIDINDPDPLLAGAPGKGPLWMFAGRSVAIMKGRKYHGTRTVDGDGDLLEELGDDFSDPGFVAGFGFTARAKQYLPNIDEGEARGQRVTRRKIKKATIHVRDATEFDFMERTFAGYKASDPGEADPPLWNGAFSGRSRGRSYDPETIFEKSVPGPCTVLEMAGSVTV